LVRSGQSLWDYAPAWSADERVSSSTSGQVIIYRLVRGS
jgi:hypothetical protein